MIDGLDLTWGVTAEECWNPSGRKDRKKAAAVTTTTTTTKCRNSGELHPDGSDFRTGYDRFPSDLCQEVEGIL